MSPRQAPVRAVGKNLNYTIFLPDTVVVAKRVLALAAVNM